MCIRRGYNQLENGKVSCNDTNLFLSQCLYECDGGYEMMRKIDEDPASVLANCTEDGEWDVAQNPVCERITCKKSIAELSAVSKNLIKITNF